MKRIFAILLSLTALVSSASAAVYNVRDFGAKGDGVSIDSPAINAAIQEAVKNGGGMVYLPAGVYASYSIRLASRIHLYLEKGCVLKAADGEQFDAPEPGPQPQYQDYGHSHWKNSFIWGIGLEDITISGEGMIDGTNLSPGYGDSAVKTGVANKTISLKECRNVSLKDFTVYRGGHFVLLATGVDNMIIDGVTVDTNRDGFDVDCCRNVRISNCNVNSPHDDGIVLKASYGLGKYVDTRNVTITNCHLSGYDIGSVLDCTYKKPAQFNVHSKKEQYARAAGRIKLGTESSGGYQNIAISNCTFDFCGGIFLESMDGGLLEDVVVSNCTMRDCIDSPIFVRLGRRMRSPEGREIGKVRRVLFSDINAYNTDPHYGVIVAGIDGHCIEDITLRNIHLNYVGGMTPADAQKSLPKVETAYPDPWMFAETGSSYYPFKGIFLRNIDGIVLDGVHFSYGKPDSRPLSVIENVTGLVTRDITLERKPTKL